MRSNTHTIALLALTSAAFFAPGPIVLAQQQAVARRIVAPILTSPLLSPDADPAPGFTSITPISGATNVALEDIVAAAFNKRMASASVNAT